MQSAAAHFFLVLSLKAWVKGTFMVYNIPHSKPVAFYVLNIKSKVETYSKLIFSFFATTLLSLLFNVHFLFFTS